MQKKSKSFIKNLSDISLLFILICYGQSSLLWAAHGKMPIDDKEVELPDGRWVLAIRNGEHSHCLIIKDKGKIVTLQKQCFELEYDRLWDYAFFVPVKNDVYVADVDGDGSFEIGIATWDGGNNIDNRYALAFSVKHNKLVYFGKKKFNLEFGEYLYD